MNTPDRRGNSYSSTPKRPLIITQKKYRNILKQLNKDEEAELASEKERKYREYLKEGSRQMVSHWNVGGKSQEAKRTEKARKVEEKRMQDQRDYLEIKENDEKIRKEKIAQAEQLVQKLKPGPQQLKIATMLSEVLQGRNIQRNIAQEFQQKAKEQKVDENHRFNMQAFPFIEEEQKRISEAQKRHNNYKSELRSSIAVKERQRNDYKNHSLKCEREANTLVDYEVQAQIERERDLLRKKQESARQNALEAMKMVEQRRLREKMQDDIDNQLMTIAVNAQEKIANIIKEKQAQAFAHHMARTGANAQHVADLRPDTEGPENEHLAKAAAEMHQKQQSLEQERINKEKAKKHARIQYYMDEMKRQKEDKERKIEEFQFAVANRLKNEDINQQFKNMKLQDKFRAYHEHRDALFDQMEQRQLTEKQEKEMDRKLNEVSFEDEDKFFFEYADNLMKHAKEKGRPLHPFIKAVQTYKKENEIDVERTVPRHLRSNLQMGLRTPEPSKSPKTPSARRYGLDELKQLNPASN